MTSQSQSKSNSPIQTRAWQALAQLASTSRPQTSPAGQEPILAAPTWALKEATLQTLLREGHLNVDGALAALQLAQGLTLSEFSMRGGAQRIAAVINRAPEHTQSFLMNMAISLSGLCYLNWGNSAAWHPLVEALTLRLDQAKISLLSENTAEAFTNDPTVRSDHGNHPYAFIISTPPLAMVLLLRWLRIDTTQQEPILQAVVDAREPNQTS